MMKERYCDEYGRRPFETKPWIYRYGAHGSMLATAAAQQMSSAAMAKGMDEDFSIMIQFMEELAGLSTRPG